MASSLLTTNGGSFNFEELSVGQTVGSASLVSGAGDISFDAILVINTLVSETEVLLSVINLEDGSLMGAFTLSNNENGIAIVGNPSYDDENNITTGNESILILEGLFEVPLQEFTFYSTINSEADNSYSQDVTVSPECDCAAALDTPTNFSIEAVPNFVTLSWDLVSEVENYNLVYNVPGYGWQDIDVVGSSVDIPFIGNGDLRFYIRSFCEDDNFSDWSSLTIFELPSCDLNLELSSTVANCADELGTISASVNGGFGEYDLSYNGVDPSNVATGTYSVTVTDELGCTVTEFITVGQEGAIIFDVLPASTAICVGDFEELSTSQEFASYQWQFENENIVGATSSTYSAGQSGIYSVVVTNDLGCSVVSSEVSVFIIEAVEPTNLVVTGSGVNDALIDWDDVSPSGSYNYSFSSDGGATWTTVNFYSGSSLLLSGLLPSTDYLFELSTIAFGCVSEPVSTSFVTSDDCVVPSNLHLTASPGNIAFTWDAVPGAESYELVYLIPGFGGWQSTNVTGTSFSSWSIYGFAYFYIRSVCGNDESSEWSDLINIECPGCDLEISLSSTNASCSDDDGIITTNVTGAFGDYSIDYNGIDPNAVPSGTYSISVVDDGGCSSAAEITVGQDIIDNITLSASEYDICSDETSLLSVSEVFESYQWQDENGPIEGATSSTYLVTSGGTYSLEAINDLGCSFDIDPINVNEITIDAPSDLTVSGAGFNSAFVDWTETSPTGVYSVSYSADGGNTWLDDNSYLGSSIFLTDLLQSTSYIFSVASVSYGCTSTESTITFSTLEECITPLNISISATPQNFTLSFDSLTSAVSYDLIYLFSGDSWMSTSITESSISINHNGYGAAYAYIRSVCEDGTESDWSELLSIELPSCELSLSVSGTDASCVDGDGTITALVDGYWGDYIIDYNGIDPTAVAAGTYTISVTDESSCVASAEVVIGQSASPIVEVSVSVNAICSGDTSIVSVTEGFASYQWYNADGIVLGETSSNYSATVAGEFYAAIVDADGCSSISNTVSVQEITISSPTNLVTIDVGVNNAFLDWDNTSPNGTYNLSISADGGDTWTEILNHDQSSYNFLDLEQQTTYTFQVSATSFGCVSQVSEISFITLEDCVLPEEFQITTTPIEVTISWDGLSSDGYYEIIYNISGQGWNYTTITESTFTTFHFGTGSALFYVKSICSDELSSDWSSLQTVELPACALSFTLSSTNETCIGNNGTITTTVSGAFNGYDVDYNGIDPAAVAAGNYSVTVTDGAGCSFTQFITVGEDDFQPLVATASDDIVCDGQTVVLSTNDSYASYQWYNNGSVIEGAISNTYSITEEGIFHVVATNDQGCDFVSNELNIYEIIISTPSNLSASNLTPTTAFLDWDPTSPSGLYSVSYSADGGNLWTTIDSYAGSSINLADLSSLTTYIFEVTALSYGCSSNDASISFTTLQSCNAPSNFEILATPQEVTFTWDAQAGAESYQLIYSVDGDWTSATVTTNSFTTTHNGGSFAQLYVSTECSDDFISGWSSLSSISLPSCELALELSSTDASCSDGDGTVTVAVSGDFDGYTIDYNGIDPSAVSAGTYTISVTDNGGCSASQIVNVGQATSPGVTITTSMESICTGESTDLTSDGDFASYQWSDENGLIEGATSSSYTANAGGDYFLSATSAEGCVSVSNSVYIYEIVIDAPTNLVVQDIGVDFVYLDWDATSQSGLYNIRYSADGGDTWTSQEDYAGSSVYLTELSVSTNYMFEVVSSSFGCLSSSSSVLFTTLEDCVLPTSLTLSATTQEVTFDWDTQPNSEGYELVYKVTGQGWQSIVVTENTFTISHYGYGYGYFYIRTICGDDFISDWSDLQYVDLPYCALGLDITTTDASCSGDDGQIDVTVSGAFISYNVNYGGAAATNVSPGTYTITATDFWGCTASQEVTINQAVSPSIAVSNDDDVICFGETTDLVSSDGFASYQWSDENGEVAGANTSTYAATAAGTYFVTAISNNGCVSVSSNINIFEIDVNTPTNLDVNNTGTDYAYLDWDATSLSGAYDVRYSDDDGSTWINIENYMGSSIFLSGLTQATSYLFEVAATSYGCTSDFASISFTTVEECATPSNLNLSATATTVTFDWDAQSGAVNYQLVYNLPGQAWQSVIVNNNTFSVTHSGNGFAQFYIVTLCSDDYVSDWSALQAIELPECTIEIQLSSTNASCINGDGTISSIVTGANGEYTIDYNGIDPNAVAVGTYVVSVTDADGCFTTASVTVGQDANPSISVTAENSIICNGGGSAILSATTGFASYQWSGPDGDLVGATSADYTALSAGEYFVTATSNEGCIVSSDEITIYEISISAPASLQTNSIGENYAYLDWDAISPSGLYNVSYSDDGGATWTDFNSYTGSSMYLSGLAAGTEYEFEVASLAYGCVSTSISITFTTTQGCAVPTNITESFVGSDVVIAWDAASGAESFDVLYNISGQGWQSMTTSTNSLTVAFIPGYSNNYYIQSNCGSGIISDWSDLQSFSYSCDDPINYTITDVGGTVTFDWDDTADNYELIYYAGNGWINVPLSESTFSLSGIAVGTQVYSYLRAVCDVASSFSSNWVGESYVTSSGAKLGQESVPYSFNIYPNPTDGILNINLQTDEEQVLSVSLIDNFGKVIFVQKENSFYGELNYRLNLSSYAKGVYYLRIVSGTSTRNERVILK